MVRKARTKKRRAGRIGKVKQKTSAYAKYKPPGIQDHVVRAHWDPTKSPSVNLERMGLSSRLNGSAASRGGVETGAKAQAAAVELFDVPESDDASSSLRGGVRTVRGKTRSMVMLPMSIDDQEYMARCMERHGDDYAAMARDTKRNVMQHTEGRLRKMGARFLLLGEEHRRAEVPERVRHLAASSSSSSAAATT